MLSTDLTGSLYSVMRGYGASPYSAEEQIEATQATEQQAEILNISAGDPLLLITRTSYTSEGLPVEYSMDFFRSDRSRIRIKSRVDSETSTRIVPAAGV